MRIILFVDALPYQYINSDNASLKFVEYCKNIVKLIPELGYSSNQHMAIFDGRLPCSTGFLGDFSRNIEPGQKNRAILSHESKLNYLIRRVLGLFAGEHHNIPLGMRTAFKKNGIYPLSETSALVKINTRYWKYQFHKVSSKLDFFEYVGKLDYSKDQFFIIDEVDHAGHKFGPKSQDYKNTIIKLDVFLTKVIEHFPNSEFVVISDHGMSDRPQRKSLNLEKVAGAQSEKSYFYFLDSSICRIWYHDAYVRNKVHDYLSALLCGRLLSREERLYFGVSENICDDVFVLYSDYFFEPQYFGFGLKSKTKGMHGCYPWSDDQYGVLCTNLDTSISSMRNLSVYDWLIENSFI